MTGSNGRVSTEQSRALQIYKLLMDEVKIRVGIIERALDGEIVVPGMMIREICYLQLRMICEIIALGCLVAHGDITATRSGKLPKEYNADRIVSLLGKLHPAFYPKPMRATGVKPHPSGIGRVHHFDPVKTGFLTKSELAHLSNKSGDFLHRGTMRKLLSPEPIDVGFPDVVVWVNKIIVLLTAHSLSLFDDREFLCTVWETADNQVHTALTA